VDLVDGVGPSGWAIASMGYVRGGDPYGLASEAALQGGAPSVLVQSREAVGGPGLGADAVVYEEKAGGIVFFFDGF
jgi:hypothetical protein